MRVRCCRVDFATSNCLVRDSSSYWPKTVHKRLPGRLQCFRRTRRKIAGWFYSWKNVKFQKSNVWMFLLFKEVGSIQTIQLFLMLLVSRTHWTSFRLCGAFARNDGCIIPNDSLVMTQSRAGVLSLPSRLPLKSIASRSRSALKSIVQAGVWGKQALSPKNNFLKESLSLSLSFCG